MSAISGSHSRTAGGAHSVDRSPGAAYQTAPGVITAPGRGPAIQLHRGSLFHLRDPQPADVVRDDFVWAASHIARYNGHASRPYVVLEHLVRACDLYLRRVGEGRFDSYRDPRLLHYRAYAATARLVLSHDMHEAACGDFTTPGKCALPEFRELEDPIEAATLRALDLAPSETDLAECKRVDLLMAAIEKRDLMAPGHVWPKLPTPPDDVVIPAEDPTYAALGHAIATIEAFIAGVQLPRDQLAQLIVTCHTARELQPAHWRSEWQKRWEALWRATRPRPTCETEAEGIADLWAAEARSGGIAGEQVQAARAHCNWPGIAGADPAVMYDDLAAWCDRGQRLYDACNATAARRHAAVVDGAVQTWVVAGCAPVVLRGAVVRLPNCAPGEGHHTVTAVDDKRARVRVDRLDWINNEDVLPCS